jgi:hypothetical protein
LGLFQYGSYERDPVHFAFNLVLFMPLGALLSHEGRRRQSKLRSVLILTGAIGLLLSLTVEYLQSYLPGRDSSLFDVLANTSGGLVGVFGDRAWGISFETGLNQMRARTTSVRLAAAMMAFMAVALFTTATLQTRTGLSNWSLEYPLLIGNERTGDRPWRGRVFALAVTDAETPLALLRRFAAGESVSLPGSHIASFDFTSDQPYRDDEGNVTDLAWTGGTSESVSAETAVPAVFTRSGPSGAIALAGRPWLQTAGPVVPFAQRLRQTNKFTLRIQCATDSPNQDGPARIVSNSFSPLLRNFTLGQQGADLVFRLRTPQTGANGYPLETIVPGVFADDRLRDIVVTYDGATLRGGIAGTDQVFRTDFTAAASIAGLVASRTSHSVRAADLPMYHMAYVAGLFILPGILIGLFALTRRQQLTLGGTYLVMTSMMLELTQSLASGRSIDWGNAFVAGAVGALVLVASVTILSQSELRHHERYQWIATESSI